MKKTIDIDPALIKSIMEVGVQNNIYDFSKALRFIVNAYLEKKE